MLTGRPITLSGLTVPEYMTIGVANAARRNTTLATGTLTHKDRNLTTSIQSYVQDALCYAAIAGEGPGIITRTSSNAGVLVPGAGVNDWTYVGDGTATLTFATARQTFTRSVSVQAGSDAEVWQFVSWVNGCLAKALSEDIDARLVGKVFADVEMYSAKNYAAKTFTRNTGCWLGNINLTCESVANDRMPDGECGGTLVAPDIALLATHFNNNPGVAPFVVGTTKMYWVGLDNTVYERTVIGLVDVGHDILAARLSSPLPAAITPAKLLPFPHPQIGAPTNYVDTVGKGVYPLPIIRLNQWKQALLGDLYALGYNNAGPDYSALGTTPYAANRQPFYLDLVGGDSGSGCYVWIDGQAVTLCGWKGGYGGSGGDRSAYLSQINAAIDTLGGATHCSVIDLSGYPTF